jgi:hypothetical protein
MEFMNARTANQQSTDKNNTLAIDFLSLIQASILDAISLGAFYCHFDLESKKMSPEQRLALIHQLRKNGYAADHIQAGDSRAGYNYLDIRWDQ